MKCLIGRARRGKKEETPFGGPAPPVGLVTNPHRWACKPTSLQPYANSLPHTYCTHVVRLLLTREPGSQAPRLQLPPSQPAQQSVNGRPGLVSPLTATGLRAGGTCLGWLSARSSRP